MNIPQAINSTKALGRVIKDRRESMGLTQLSAGKLVGVHQTTVSDVERGMVKVQIDTLLKLIAALRLELIIQPVQAEKTQWEEIWKDNGA